jgi:hypothetical protein
MRRDCPECQRLWREYAAATNTHIALENKLRTLEQGSSQAEALMREVSAAAIVRENARQAIQKHEASLHESPAESSEMGG